MKIGIGIVPNKGSNLDTIWKKIEWPTVPCVGDEIDICPPGMAGGYTVIVYKKKHWLGIEGRDVDVYCKFKGKTKGQVWKDIWNDIKSIGWSR